MVLGGLADHDFVVSAALMGRWDPWGDRAKAVKAGRAWKNPSGPGPGTDHPPPGHRMTPGNADRFQSDPVPIVIRPKPVNIRKKDQVTEYDEIHGAQGGLNRMTGHMFFQFLMDYLEVVPKGN